MSSQRDPLACRSLTKRFDGRTVVREASFSVEAGSITGFVGANGAGKTTTMRMLLGLVHPSAGTATINGRRYRDLEHPRREVGSVIDGPGAHPSHSARTHLATIAVAAGLRRSRVDDVLDQVQLTEHAHRRVGTLSMGMLQRLALATALLGDPGVLVLDEPINGLDPPGIVWLRDLLRSFAAEGRALLVSTHQLAELAEIADHVVVIDGGRIVADAPLAMLLDSPTPGVRLRCAHPARLRVALRAHAASASVDPTSGALVVEGLDAHSVGELVERAGAGPVYELTALGRSIEDVYFGLADGAAAADSMRGAS